MKYLAGFAAFIAVIVLSVVANGYALSVLWGWFIAPYFGLPVLNIPTAIGLALVVGYLKNQDINSDETAGFIESLVKIFGRAIFRPAFALFIGWIVTFFI